MPSGAHESLNPPQSDKVAKADKDARDLKLHKNESGEVAKHLATFVRLICTRLEKKCDKLPCGAHAYRNT